MSPQQQTITEKEVHLAHREREHQTTLRVLRAYPADKASFKPHPTSMTALETAWMMILIGGDGSDIAAAEMKMEEPPGPPKTWPELIAAYEKAYAGLVRGVKALSDDQLNETMRVPMGPKRTESYRRGDVLWWGLFGQVHHRGQLSVYLRAVGGKVPAIYGPSGDDPME
jgi:uncharacterized damage-inducible protein DinB